MGYQLIVIGDEILASSLGNEMELVESRCSVNIEHGMLKKCLCMT